MDLSGKWRARVADDEMRRSYPDPATDDEHWAALDVPGHWREDAAFAHSDGPLLYRHRFEYRPPSGRRVWLTLDGVFYQADVWLDGSYLGDTEGYFLPHSFEVTDHTASASEHLLAVEVTCAPQRDRRAKRNLTGVFQHWDCIDEDWNPGGIWAPVRVHTTGPVRIASLRVTCPEATAERAALDLVATLDAKEALDARLVTTVRPAGDGTASAGDGTANDGDGTASDEAAQVAEVAGSTAEHRLAEGANQVRWRVIVERPNLWWPRALGSQPLHTVDVAVDVGGEVSDRRSLTTGLRQVTLRDFVATVNGERIFLKGANLGPTDRAPADVTPTQVAADVDLAVGAGLDLLRVHAHIARPEVYDAADRAGLLLWQDLPLQWAYKGVRRQAVRQARAAVDLLAHHPSVAIWCAHNEPFAMEAVPGHTGEGLDRWRWLAGQALPSWNRTWLDRSLKRALGKSDGSRPVVTHSGVLPHPTGGTDSHLYQGWYTQPLGELAATFARFPVLARWVGEFGAQAIPYSDAFMEPERWPDLDWDRLERHHSLQRGVLERWVPAGGHRDLASWRDATQAYQADVIRHHVETLRRLKYRPTGGFCQFLLADAQAAVSWSVLDHRRVPKAGYQALRDACAPVIAVADRPAPVYRPGDRLRLNVHVVSDLRIPLDGVTARATLRWPGGGHRQWNWGGDVPPDSCVRVGRLDMAIPPCPEGNIRLEVAVDAPDPAPPVPVATYLSRVGARLG